MAAANSVAWRPQLNSVWIIATLLVLCGPMALGAHKPERSPSEHVQNETRRHAPRRSDRRRRWAAQPGSPRHAAAPSNTVADFRPGPAGAPGRPTSRARLRDAP